MASIMVQTSDVLDIRLPQMQVGPNVIKRKAGRDAAEDALESLMTEDELVEAQDRLYQEFVAYFTSVGQVMLHMASCQYVSKAWADVSARFR